MLEVNKIYCGDCVELIKEIDDEIIDLTVSSPPYDKLKKYEGYTFNFEEIAKELYRVTKKSGVVVWVVGDAVVKGSETGTSFKQALYFKEIGFNLHDTMIYEKNSSTFPAKRKGNRYTQIFEFMLVFSKGSPKANLLCDKKNKWAGHTSFDGKIPPVPDYSPRTNIWKYTTSMNDKNDHPAVFPEELAEDHILSWSNEGNLILDVFNGCYDKKTEILTKKGWKYFKDISVEDMVAVVSDNGILNFEKPIRFIKYKYNGEMISFKSYHYDLLVTPDHNVFILLRYKDNWRLEKARNVKTQWKFKTTVKWLGKNIDKICINPENCSHKDSRHVSYQTVSKKEIRFCYMCRKKYTVSDHPFADIRFEYDAHIFLKFLGFYLAEGWIYKNTIIISQTKREGREYIEKILTDLKISFNYSFTTKKYRFSNKKMANYLRRFGSRSFNKHLVKDIKELNPALLSSLLEGLIAGDGSVIKNLNKNSMKFYTSSTSLANDVQEISLKCGYATSLYIRDRKNNYSFIKGRKIKTIHLSITLSISKNRKTPRVYKINKEFYNDFVYCVEVNEPHIIVVRRNGKVVLSGNSGTTCKMAYANGRKYIGMDVSEKYCKIARDRVKDIRPKIENNIFSLDK